MPRESTKRKMPQKKTVKGRAKNLRSVGDARKSLLLAGKKLFAKKGLSATSIRDIAKEAGVNSSLISYYFEGKEKLYTECLREIGETRLNFAKEVLKTPENENEFRIRLKLFIENLFALYLEDRDAGLIVVREYDRINSPAEDVFKDTFLKIFDLLVQFFKQAQNKNILSKKKDSFILASLFFGSLSSQMRLDHIKSKEYQRSLKDPLEQKKVLEHIIDQFTN